MDDSSANIYTCKLSLLVQTLDRSARSHTKSYIKIKPTPSQELHKLIIEKLGLCNEGEPDMNTPAKDRALVLVAKPLQWVLPLVRT